MFVVLTGLSAAEAAPVLLAVGCAGFCIVGAQNASNAVAAMLYPLVGAAASFTLARVAPPDAQEGDAAALPPPRTVPAS